MLRLFILVFTPLLSLIIFTLGSGLLTTLLTVRLHTEGGSDWIIGLMTAVYYLGMVFGSFYIGSLIRRVGHIRVYSICAAALAAAIMLQGIIINDWVWIILRFICGYGTAGIYIAIESWLLVVAPPERRGQVISLYMILFYLALVGGQFFLNIGDPTNIIPFCIVTIFCTLSIIPLSMTKAACPNLEDLSALNFKQLYKVSPSGVIGCFAAGLITSAIYGLMPLFVKQLNLPTAYVASVMGATIFGACVLQYPVGRLSDFFDRRKVLVIISFASLAISFVLMPTAYYARNMFLVILFIFGGVSFTLYPLSITHTSDYLKGRDIVAATQGLLLANGVGSIIGPIIVPGFFRIFGPLGLFIYFAIISGLLGIFFSWRRTKKSPTPVEEQQEFVPIPRTTPVVTELDPRAEE